jgi:hypothetical protein
MIGVQVKTLTAFSLGGGRYARPGDTIEMSAADARRRLFNRDIELIAATQQEMDDWDRLHGLLPADSREEVAPA